MALQSPTILLVEDDPPTRESLIRLLRAERFKVVAGATGAEALSRAADQPDVILLDVGLPDISGFEVSRRLKGDPTTAGIPIIQMSGQYVSYEDRVQGLEDGADAYLIKPVEHRELLTQIRSMCRVRNAELAFRALANNVPDIIARFDKELRYVYANRHIEKISGLPPRAFLGKTNRELGMPKAMVKLWDEMLSQTLASAKPVTLEFEFPTPDGIRNFESRLIPEFAVDHSVESVLVICSDRTERKRLEEHLRQSQKMEAIGQLAGGVAHDFNNMLTIISGYSELLLSRMPANDPGRSAVEQIHHAGERATGLTRQLLAFSRKAVIEPRVLDLNAVIAETQKMLRRLIGEDVLLTTVLDPNISHVRADLGQLDQLVLNLAVNARDAMPHGGRLTIETKNVALDASYTKIDPEAKPGRYVMMAVTDTGCGMPPEIRSRIFEPFFTTKEVGKGTGLGLATVYGIVKQNGGSIGVYSEEGVGTCFKVYLPVASSKFLLEVESDLLKELRGSETVMLVEDDAEVRRIALLALEECGYRILEASSGTEALELADRHGTSIDLLITDVVMPGMNGRQVAEALKTTNPSLSVLYMSGYTDDAVVRHGLLRAEVAFLQKPFKPSALTRKVRDVLDK